MTTTHPTLDDSIVFAATLHAGQVDRAGVPYIAHPLAVMRRVPAPRRHVAVLHDVREDCGVTSEVSRERGYSEEEIVALDALTRRGDEEYSAYIDRVIAAGRMAIKVKLSDLEDNMDLWRLVVVTAKDRERVEKYRAARGRLAIAPLDLTGVAW